MLTISYLILKLYFSNTLNLSVGDQKIITIFSNCFFNTSNHTIKKNYKMNIILYFYIKLKFNKIIVRVYTCFLREKQMNIYISIYHQDKLVDVSN